MSNCIPNLLLVAQVLWLCDFVTMWLYDNVTRWLCDCNDLATCLHSFAVSSVTKFPTDCSSIERHPVFWGFVWWIVFCCVCVYYSFTQIRSRLVLVVSIPAINWLGLSFKFQSLWMVFSSCNASKARPILWHKTVGSDYFLVIFSWSFRGPGSRKI